MNIVTRGFGNNSLIITRGYGPFQAIVEVINYIIHAATTIRQATITTIKLRGA